MLNIAYAVSGIAGLSWLIAALSAAQLATQHPGPDRTWHWYISRGFAFLDPGNFAESGAAVHHRMMMAMAGFGLSAAMTAALVFMAQAAG